MRSAMQEVYLSGQLKYISTLKIPLRHLTQYAGYWLKNIFGIVFMERDKEMWGLF